MSDTQNAIFVVMSVALGLLWLLNTVMNEQFPFHTKTHHFKRR